MNRRDPRMEFPGTYPLPPFVLVARDASIQVSLQRQPSEEHDVVEDDLNVL